MSASLNMPDNTDLAGNQCYSLAFSTDRNSVKPITAHDNHKTDNKGTNGGYTEQLAAGGLAATLVQNNVDAGRNNNLVNC